MAKCPKCEKEITVLREYSKFLKESEFYILKGVAVSVPTDQIPLETEDYFYVCPECGDDLFNDTDEASNFLKEG